jgi:phosphoserine phosphatase RsbU/P
LHDYTRRFFSSIRPRRHRPRAISSFIAGAAGLCFALGSSIARAQTFDATDLREPADLGCKWLVTSGDDPGYARTDLDDSHWTPFDPHSSITDIFGKTHPKVVWYRLRVKVNPNQTGLALREMAISGAFEVYVNGERLITSGQIAPYIPYTSGSRILKGIPDRLLASGSLLIAMRVSISKVDWISGQDPGFYATNLTIGQQNTLYRDDWLAIIGQHTFDWVDRFLLIALGIVALLLFSAQRSQTQYLWIFALGALQLGESVLPLVSVFYNFPAMWNIALVPFRLVSPFIWVSFYFSFVHQRIGWRWRVCLGVAGLANAYSGLAGLYVLAIPLPLELIGNLPFIILLSVVVPIVLAVHLRRGNREAGILLIPVVLFSLYIYAEVAFASMFQFPGSRSFALRGLNFIDRFPAGPFSLSLNDVSGILSTLSLAIIMLLRSTSMSRRQAQLEGELAAAQQVQHVLLPEHTENVPGFNVETAYQPAQQVGGDFFQILPAGQGGLLVIVGDVAGKGLPAAMLVSVLVGAIRATADHTHSPQELLASLNERLVGRGTSSFSTALAAHIAANGAVTISNAGHLSPYLDGREIELPGALPLGVMTGVTFDSVHIHLAAGSRLTFYSDGVIEAQNGKGELFGFERGKAISTEPAAAIVEAAVRFGQSDDITVVTITRAVAAASAA